MTAPGGIGPTRAMLIRLNALCAIVVDSSNPGCQYSRAGVGIVEVYDGPSIEVISTWASASCICALTSIANSVPVCRPLFSGTVCLLKLAGMLASDEADAAATSTDSESSRHSSSLSEWYRRPPVFWRSCGLPGRFLAFHRCGRPEPLPRVAQERLLGSDRRDRDHQTALGPYRCCLPYNPGPGSRIPR